MEESNFYRVYTDGSSNNSSEDKIAGIGVVVVLDGDILLEKGDLIPGLNSNAAEMTAALEGIRQTIENFNVDSNARIRIYSDSTYVVNTINTWMHIWRRQNFMTGFNKSRRPRPNAEIISEIYSLWNEYRIDAKWIKGHVGNAFNEHANNIAYDIRKNYIDELD